MLAVNDGHAHTNQIRICGVERLVAISVVVVLILKATQNILSKVIILIIRASFPIISVT